MAGGQRVDGGWATVHPRSTRRPSDARPSSTTVHLASTWQWLSGGWAWVMHVHVCQTTGGVVPSVWVIPVGAQETLSLSRAVIGGSVDQRLEHAVRSKCWHGRILRDASDEGPDPARVGARGVLNQYRIGSCSACVGRCRERVGSLRWARSWVCGVCGACVGHGSSLVGFCTVVVDWSCFEVTLRVRTDLSVTTIRTRYLNTTGRYPVGSKPK
jgi:hypothetical protein